METAGLIVLIIVAIGFDFTNGFHDSANAIATSISTGAIKPRNALALAAVFNLLGSLVSTKVASTVGKGIISVPYTHEGLVVVFSALLGAITWNLITWVFGLPSSSSHALIGGLCGAAIASSGTVKWGGVVDKVVIPMVLSPLVGFVLAFVVMVALMWLLRRANPREATVGFKLGQWLSSAAMSFGHGLQDAQKTMGVIALSLVVTHHLATHGGSLPIPLWVKIVCALAISAGTYSGGWRIMRTLGRRVFKLDSSSAFTAQAVASSVLMTTAYVYAAPISTTHVITSSVMGVGATRKLSAVRWGVAGNILVAWILTLPAAGLVAAGCYVVIQRLV